MQKKRICKNLYQKSLHGSKKFISEKENVSKFFEKNYFFF